VFNFSNNASQSVSIGVYERTGIKSGTFALNRSKGHDNGGAFRDYRVSYKYGYYTDSMNIGSLTIAIDSVHKSISGSFYFNAKYDNGASVIKITDGNFRVRYFGN
jgi:hypothetical protein